MMGFGTMWEDWVLLVLAFVGGAGVLKLLGSVL